MSNVPDDCVNNPNVPWNEANDTCPVCGEELTTEVHEYQEHLICNECGWHNFQDE